jgi:hypothetical protein
MVLSARFKNKRGLFILVRVIRLYINKIPIATQCGPWGLLSVYIINSPGYQQLLANSMSTDFCTRPGTVPDCLFISPTDLYSYIHLAVSIHFRVCYSWVSLRYYAVNLTGGQPQMY